MTDEERGGSFSANPGRPIIVVDFSPVLREIAVETMKTAHPEKNAQKCLQKR
jgi:hypothetical protein